MPVADYGRRLSLGSLPRAQTQTATSVGAERTLLMASACANRGFHVFAPCYAHVCDSRTLDQIRVNSMMKCPWCWVLRLCGIHLLGPSHGCGGRPGLGPFQGTVFSPVDMQHYARVTGIHDQHVRMTSCDGVNHHRMVCVFDASGVETL